MDGERRDMWMWREAMRIAADLPTPQHVRVLSVRLTGLPRAAPWTEADKEAARRRFAGDYSAEEDAEGNPLEGE